jgi:hypothetical protein
MVRLAASYVPATPHAHATVRQPVAVFGVNPANGWYSLPRRTPPTAARLAASLSASLGPARACASSFSSSSVTSNSPRTTGGPYCSPFSAGERRRQLAVHASEHLLKCATCADLSAPLLERRRSIAGLLPLIGLRPLFAAVGRAAKNGKVQAAVGVSAVAGVIAIGVLARPTPARAPAKS